MRILAIGAHPDDVECGCAGMLAKCAARGDQVFACVCTNGELGSVVIASVELVAVREQEARAGAAIYGAELWWMGEPDGFLFSEPRAHRQMDEVFEWATPDLVLAHGPDSYHADHRASGVLAQDAWARRRPVGGGGPALFYMDSEAGIDYAHSIYVDISDTIQLKLAALACHRSQLDWILAHDGVDLVAKRRELCRLRGRECGAEYAECFRPAWPGGMHWRELLP